MESNNNNGVVTVDISAGVPGSTGSSTTGGGGYSRWNPTKEQIEMLEGLYKQGIRTPSAEQIQQITVRLRAFGHIEGKNVFYWFQNHKARQRQKQKQQNHHQHQFSNYYFNRFLHHHNIPTSTPSPNNVCSPYCIPYTDLAISRNHQQKQQPKILLPRVMKRKLLPPEKMPVTAPVTGALPKEYYNCSSSKNKQTLDLFPLQPTGGRDADDLLRPRTSPSSSSSTRNPTRDDQSLTSYSGKKYNFVVREQQHELDSPAGSGVSGGNGNGNGHLCFFDFFCESH